MNNLVGIKAAIELRRLELRRVVAGVFEHQGFRVASAGSLLLAIRDGLSVPT